MNGLSFILAGADPLDHVLPHTLFKVGGIGFTNHMLMSGLAGLLMLLIFPRLFARPVAEAPSGARNFFEAILAFLRTEVFRPALKQHTDRFVPFLWTVFFFILFCNLLGWLPIAEVIYVLSGKTINHVGGTATGNINTTAALAVCAFVAIHVLGVLEIYRSLRAGTYGHHGHDEEDAHGATVAHGTKVAHGTTADHGTAHPAHGHDDDFADRRASPATAAAMALPLYLWNFAPHPFKPPAGSSILKWIPDVLLWGLLLVLELIGALVKPFSLMIRLFANMIAGHIVLAALLTLILIGSSVAAQIGIGVPVTVLSMLVRVLELFVSFLQAYIFTFLTTLFIAGAVAPEH